jgi:hypothetical protein
MEEIELDEETRKIVRWLESDPIVNQFSFRQMSGRFGGMQVYEGAEERLDKLLIAFEFLVYEPALPFLEEFISFVPRTEAEAQQNRRAFATLKYIKENAGKERARRTLLRPSSAAEQSCDTLLRPAGFGMTNALKRLLRPTDQVDFDS